MGDCDRERPCPECGDDDAPVWDQDSGDLICSNCGVVVQGQCIDDTQEWRIFADTSEKEKQEKNRAGAIMNPFLNNGGMTSTIGNRALNRVNRLVQGQENRTLKASFAGLREIQETLHSSIAALNCAFEIASALEQRRQLRVKQSDLAAIIYIACRQEDEGRSMKEIASALTGVAAKDIGRAFLRFEKYLPKTVQMGLKDEALPENFLPRFCNKLLLAVELENVMRQVCSSQVVGNAQNQRQPAAVAAGCIYLVAYLAGVDLSISKIAGVSKVTEATIADAVKAIRPLIHHVLPPSFRIQRELKHTFR